MSTLSMSSVYDDLLDFILQQASPEEIIAFKVSPAKQAHVDDLIDRLKTSALSEDEKRELEQIQQFDRLVSLLKARAQSALQNQ